MSIVMADSGSGIIGKEATDKEHSLAINSKRSRILHV